jgi:hypothetical protein
MSNNTTLQWYYKVLAESKRDDNTFNRLEFYREYFENLSPAGFIVDVVNNNIVISIDDEDDR